MLEKDQEIRAIAQELTAARDVLYLGRGTSYAVALEGALKLKEISYIHAEAYAAGELKHGPIALIDESVPVIVVAPRDHLFEKTASNLQEVVARGGRVVLLSDAEGVAELGDFVWRSVVLPAVDAVRGADPLRDTGPAAGLSHGRPQGHGRRPAAQPGQERHGRVAAMRA